MTLASHAKGIQSDIPQEQKFKTKTLVEHIGGNVVRLTQDNLDPALKTEFLKTPLNDVETLSLHMLDDEQSQSLALEHSIFDSPEEMQKLPGVKLRYYFILPFAMIAALFVCVKIWWFRMKIWEKQYSKDINEKTEFMLGPRKRMSWVFDYLTPIIFAVRHGVATSVTLDFLYNFPMIENTLPYGKFRKWLISMWFNLPESLGVRNRIKLVYKFLLEIFEDTLSKISSNETIKVLVLASGSAQGSIEATAAFKRKHPNVKIELLLVDLSESSLRRAAQLAKKHGLINEVITLQANIKEFLAYQISIGAKWHVVEQVGFLDYRDDESASKNVTDIHQILNDNGVFITATICPSVWAFVVRWLVNWPFLIRRSSTRFLNLLRKNGYRFIDSMTCYEPTKTFFIATCQKELT